MTKAIACIFLVGLIGCAESEHYKIKFENVDRLTEGDKVFIKGLEVGEVTEITVGSDYKVLVTILVTRNIKLTKGSTFRIRPEFLGTRYVDIDLVDNPELINPDELQTGYVSPPDTTAPRKLTKEEIDGLVNHDPIFRLADTLMTILRKHKDSEKTND
jgi:ABC-type transporter Mla subunit MlaD